jgi:hypothetical protein
MNPRDLSDVSLKASHTTKRAVMKRPSSSDLQVGQNDNKAKASTKKSVLDGATKKKNPNDRKK